VRHRQGSDHEQGVRAKWLFYESDVEQGDLDAYLPRKPGYTMQGVNLPPGVLDKIYRENAARVIPGW
jgi:hypothetical protein